MCLSWISITDLSLFVVFFLFSHILRSLRHAVRDTHIPQAYNYWLNDMYMDVRLPLPINSNPGMVLPPRKFTTVHNVARFAAQIIDGILQYKEIIDKCVELNFLLQNVAQI